MKVWLQPPAELSLAMHRVSRALGNHLPTGAELALNESDADFVLLHVIGFQDVPEVVAKLEARGQKFAIMQYCRGHLRDEWEKVWSRAACVMSYYDLQPEGRFNFYHSPLGVDPVFVARGQSATESNLRNYSILTSGYVAGPGAEAIAEPVEAAHLAGYQESVHLGPAPVGMTVPSYMRLVHGIPDTELAEIYTTCHWVSGLRHVEGFELPAVEGLVCGARALVFDRAEMRQWYGEHAVYVPECSGQELIDLLVPLFHAPPTLVTLSERRAVAARFDWKTIAAGLWERAL